MKNVISAVFYRSEYQAVFQYAEYSYAKHAHFQDKQKYRTGMIGPGQSRISSCLNYGKPLVLDETSGFYVPVRSIIQNKGV